MGEKMVEEIALAAKTRFDELAPPDAGNLIWLEVAKSILAVLKRPSVSGGGEWQLVPKIPTREMQNAGWAGFHNAPVGYDTQHAPEVASAWDRMLAVAAALKPPVGGG